MPPADTLQGYAVFTTTDPAPQKLAIPRAASRWRKQELDLLGVEYEFRRFDTLPQEIMDGNDMPPEFIQSMYPPSSSSESFIRLDGGADNSYRDV